MRVRIRQFAPVNLNEKISPLASCEAEKREPGTTKTKREAQTEIRLLTQTRIIVSVSAKENAQASRVSTAATRASFANETRTPLALSWGMLKQSERREKITLASLAKEHHCSEVSSISMLPIE